MFPGVGGGDVTGGAVVTGTVGFTVVGVAVVGVVGFTVVGAVTGGSFVVVVEIPFLLTVNDTVGVREIRLPFVSSAVTRAI